jgi:O-antigen ligase
MWFKTDSNQIEKIFFNKISWIMFSGLAFCVLFGWILVKDPSYSIVIALSIGFLFLTLSSSYWALTLLFAMIPISWGLPGIQIGIINLKWSYLMGAILGGKIFWEKIIRGSKLGLGKELNIPLSLFLFCALLSALTSIDPLWSIKEFVQLAYYVLVLWLVVNLLADETLVKRATKDWFSIVVILSISGIFEWLLGKGSYDPTGGSKRLLIGFGDPNATANFLLVGIALGIAQGLNLDFPFTKRIFFLTGTLILWTSLILTFSRTGWIIGTLVTIYLLLFVKGRTSPRFGFIVVLVLVSLLIFNLFASPLLSRIQSIGSLGESSNVGHLKLWYLAILTALDHPLLGVGTGAFPIYFRLTGLEGWVKVGSGSTYLSGKEGYFGGVGAHNAFLQLWAEIGTIGFLALLFLLFKVIKKTFISLRSSKGIDHKGNLLGTFSAFIAISLHNLSITGMVDYYWMILGLLIAYLKLEERKGG